MTDLQEARVARLAECHNNKRRVTTSTPAPQRTKPEPQQTKPSPAVEYWLSELATRDTATKELYQRQFKQFLAFAGKTADELLNQRIQNQTNPDRKIQRQIESQLIQFIASKREQGYSPATLQTYFAAVRSFFDVHYYPLIMRKNDYPKGESNGQRKATKEAIVKAIEHRTSRTIPTLKPVLLFLKDTGMRVGDARAMNAKEIYDQIQSNPKVISVNIRTEKQHITQQTFIGEEAIQALKEYFELRQKGSQKVKPETITEKSPLFRTWRSRQVKRISRSALSGLIYNAFRRINEAKMSAHSLRKYTQTTLEEANVNANWIDLIIGHVLPNSRGAYSLPDNEKLKETYVKAYPCLRVYPDPTPKPATPEPKPEAPATTPATSQPIDLIAQLLQRGFEATMNPNGTMTFKNPNAQQPQEERVEH